jgi:hypothetical protein
MIEDAEILHVLREQSALQFWSQVPHGCQAVEKYLNEQSQDGIRFSISSRFLSVCLSNKSPSSPALHSDSAASPAATDVMSSPVFLIVRRMSYSVLSFAGPNRDELVSQCKNLVPGSAGLNLVRNSAPRRRQIGRKPHSSISEENSMSRLRNQRRVNAGW